MISNRPMIPMLTHVDNLGDLDMTSQEESLQHIDIGCSDIKRAVGTTEDRDTATTVIGLLKSIVNKLS